MAPKSEGKNVEIAGIDANRLRNQDGRRVRMRGRQAGQRPAAVEAAAFFGDLRRGRCGMEMERQEENRQKQQHPDHAPVGAGFYA